MRDVPQLHVTAQVPRPSSTVRGSRSYKEDLISGVDGDLIRFRNYVLMNVGFNRLVS